MKTDAVDKYGKKSAAENATKKIAGVRAVAEEIQVGISPGLRKTDTEIAAAVATVLGWHIAIQADKIRIRVENGFVTLEGMVDWNFQRTAASDAIMYLEGVKRVHNHIYVKPYFTAADIRQMIRSPLQRPAMIDSGIGEPKRVF
jgi:osmotically-inducible protein OsmY